MTEILVYADLSFISDISTKDDFQKVFITFHRNTTYVGTLDTDFLKLESHNLERAFIECSLQTRIPSIAFGHSGDVEGYAFHDDYATKCSYLHVLDTLAKLTESGTEDFSLETFKTKKFFLPFNLSPSLSNYDSVTSEKIQQNSINPVSSQRKLYLKFKSNLTYTIRVSVIYFQHRSLKVDGLKHVYKSFDVDQ